MRQQHHHTSSISRVNNISHLPFLHFPSARHRVLTYDMSRDVAPSIAPDHLYINQHLLSFSFNSQTSLANFTTS